MKSTIRPTSRRRRRATARDIAVMRAKMADAVVVPGFGHAIARILLQREEKQVHTGRIARPRGAASSSGSRDHQCTRKSRKQAISKSSHASWRQRSRSVLTATSKSWSCSTGADIPPWCCAVLVARRSNARTVPSLLTHHKREHKMVCHYCGYTAPAQSLCPLRQRVRVTSGYWFGEAGRIAARHVSTGSRCPPRSRHSARP